MQNQIIIIIGTPGVGKTDLAKLLAKRRDSLYLNIGDLVKNEKLYRNYERSSKSFIIDELRLKRRLAEFFLLNRGKGIVVETHSLGRFMPKRRNMIALVLRLDPMTLARRLKARKWDRQKIWENVEAELIDQSLYEAWRLLGASRIREIDTSFIGSNVLLRKSMKLVSSPRRVKGKPVDWLRRYDPLEVSRSIL